MTLIILWFVLLGVLMAGYAILDGFDLGAGILHLFARRDEDRRVIMNAIGPVWDGNEVWLVTFGGALFAAFRVAYATAFSAFYTPFMLLLCALVFRAAALEFRSKLVSEAWRNVWDIVFSAASFLAALLFGVAVGNVLRGLAIEDLVYRGSFHNFLNPFCVLTGLMVVALFALHGALYLRMKVSDGLAQHVERWISRSSRLYVFLFVLVTISAVINIPHARTSVIAWFSLLLMIVALAGINVFTKLDRPLAAFLCSAANIALLVTSFAAIMFPNLLISTLGQQHYVTIYNAANSGKTLMYMTIILCITLPFILAYSAWVYLTFRGKVELGKDSY